MAKPVDVEIRWGIEVELNEDDRLSATLFLPAESAPGPVLVGISPYGADFHHERAVYLASNGFACLVVDVRGRANSPGHFHPLNDLSDNHRVVEWVARQPFCNGQVAMWGGSYLGYAQWAAASQAPPHLTTIVPVAAPFRGVDSPLRNNVFTPYTVRWLMLLAGRTTQARLFADEAMWGRRFRRWFESGRPFNELDTFVGYPSSLFQEYLTHPHRDAYWDAYNPTWQQYARLSIPILTITGAYDGDQPGALAHYRAHMDCATPSARSLHYLVIGPWDHAGTGAPKAQFSGLCVGPASLIDMGALHLQWYAWVMQGGPKPDFLKKNVAYYVTGSEKWRYADTLEAVTARAEILYLRSSANASDVFKSGTLTSQMPGEESPDHYLYDPRDTSTAELESTIDQESLTDQRMIHAALGKQLIYHSAPFEEDVEVSGFFELCAWLSIDQPDTDFRVTVYELALDGSVLKLTSDWVRARYRESFREARLIDTTEPLRYEFQNFTFVSRLIRKGHRLRLVFGPINSIYSQRNHNSGRDVAEESWSDARAVTVRLFHDRAHPSALYVPIASAEASA